VSHLVETSRQALAQSLASLQAAVDARDAAGASHWAHNLQGGLLNAGFDELAAVALEIERAAAGGTPGGHGERLESLRAGLAGFLDRS